MLAYCKFNGIGVIPWAPLASGDLARPFGTESVRRTATEGSPLERKPSEADKTIITRVEELATKKGVKMGQIALAWIGQKVASPIVGVNSIQRLEESIVTEVTLTPEEVAYLEEPYVRLLCSRLCRSSVIPRWQICPKACSWSLLEAWVDIDVQLYLYFRRSDDMHVPIRKDE